MVKPFQIKFFTIASWKPIQELISIELIEIALDFLFFGEKFRFFASVWELPSESELFDCKTNQLMFFIEFHHVKFLESFLCISSRFINQINSLIWFFSSSNHLITKLKFLQSVCSTYLLLLKNFFLEKDLKFGLFACDIRDIGNNEMIFEILIKDRFFEFGN